MTAARGQFTHCQHTHMKTCREGSFLVPPILPTRVIRINSHGIPRLCLQPFECGEYAALSYVWGGDQPKTLNDNITQFIEEISQESLAQATKDAIRAIRGLEILRDTLSLGRCVLHHSRQSEGQKSRARRDGRHLPKGNSNDICVKFFKCCFWLRKMRPAHRAQIAILSSKWNVVDRRSCPFSHRVSLQLTRRTFAWSDFSRTIAFQEVIDF